MPTRKKATTMSEEARRDAFARQVRSNIELMRQTFNEIDIEALEERIKNPGEEVEFGCFGSAGTFGCVTGCAGTAGTFGCAGFTGED